MIMAFGVFFVVLGIAICISPRTVYGYFGSFTDLRRLKIFSVAFRLVLAITLLLAAEGNRFPMAMTIFGVASLAGALFIALLAKEDFASMVQWAITLPPAMLRVGGLLGLCFGGFLVFSVN